MNAARLTPAQEKGIATLRAVGPLTPREFAAAMWPDSPAWERRTRGQRGTNRAGAMGGTMPMNGARLLWRLYDLGLARPRGDRRWEARPLTPSASATSL